MIRIPTNRKPTHPGEMLHAEFLEPMKISPQELAASIHVSLQTITEVISQNGAVTPSLALRLAKFFSMSEDFWLNLQLRWDLYQAQKVESAELLAIKPFQADAQNRLSA